MLQKSIHKNVLPDGRRFIIIKMVPNLYFNIVILKYD